MATLPTTEDIERLGQLQHAQFPVAPDPEDFHVLLQDEIMLASAEIEREAPSVWSSSNPGIQKIITRAIAFRTLASLWQMISCTMVGYDAEALPPEYVEPEQAQAHRDYYLARSKELIAAIETSPSADTSFALPVMRTSGLDQDDVYTRGAIWNWAQNGRRPE